MVDSISLFLKWWWQGLASIFADNEKLHRINVTNQGVQLVLPNQTQLEISAVPARLKNKTWYFCPESNQVLITSIAKHQVRQSDKVVVESLTPFNFDEVYSSIDENRSQLAVISKKHADQKMQQLHADGFNLQGIILDGNQASLIHQLKAAPATHLKVFTIAGLLLLLMFAGLNLAVHQLQQTQLKLQTQLSNNSPNQSQQEQPLTPGQNTQLQQYARHTINNRVTTLNSVINSLSDDVQIQQLLIKADELIIDGSAKNASIFRQQLEKSTYLSDVEFVTSVSLDKKTKAERFKLTAKIKSGVADE